VATQLPVIGSRTTRALVPTPVCTLAPFTTGFRSSLSKGNKQMRYDQSLQLGFGLKEAIAQLRGGAHVGETRSLSRLVIEEVCHVH